MLAACLALVVTLLAGNPILAELRRRKLGDSYSGDEPEAYASKAGTPVMGGVIFTAGILAAAIPFAVVRDSNILLPLGVMLGGGLLGGFDDMQTLEGRQKLTGHERWFFFVKWGVLLVLGSGLAAVLYFDLDYKDAVVPHFGGYSLGVLYLPLVVIIFVVAVSGAVITDGMDGLMAGVSAFAYAAYGAIALAQGQDELGAFCFAVVGALCRLPLVQRLPGPGVHGRLRLAGAWRAASWPSPS